MNHDMHLYRPVLVLIAVLLLFRSCATVTCEPKELTTNAEGSLCDGVGVLDPTIYRGRGAMTDRVGQPVTSALVRDFGRLTWFM